MAPTMDEAPTAAAPSRFSRGIAIRVSVLALCISLTLSGPARSAKNWCKWVKYAASLAGDAPSVDFQSIIERDGVDASISIRNRIRLSDFHRISEPLCLAGFQSSVACKALRKAAFGLISIPDD